MQECKCKNVSCARMGKDMFAQGLRSHSLAQGCSAAQGCSSNSGASHGACPLVNRTPLGPKQTKEEKSRSSAPNKSVELRLNLNRSSQRGDSTAYNTPFRMSSRLQVIYLSTWITLRCKHARQQQLATV